MPDSVSDLDLWHSFKQGDNLAKNELLRRMEKPIRQRVALYRDVPIPEAAILGHAKMRALEAFETYDPKKGTQLTTHVVNHLQRVSRYVNQGKNIARIPEHRFLRVGLYQSIADSMNVQLGREPSPEEMADELGWSHKEVLQTQKSLGQRALSESAMPEGAEDRHRDRSHETMSFVRSELTPPERVAFDHLYGFGGEKPLSVEQIAKKTKLSTDAVYRLRRETARRIQTNL